MAGLEEKDVFCYFPFPRESIPEAFPELNKAPNLSMLPKSGCSGLQVRLTNGHCVLSGMSVEMTKMARAFSSVLHFALLFFT